MTVSAIPQAIINRYRSGAFFTDALTAWENAAFTKPALSVAWAALFHLPAAQVALTLSTTNDNVGLVQIDLNYPKNAGLGGVWNKADAMIASFQRGTILSHAGQVVHITTSDISQGREVDGWHRVSLSIGYRAFVTV
jgi:hypothetical protein